MKRFLALLLKKHDFSISSFLFIVDIDTVMGKREEWDQVIDVNPHTPCEHHSAMFDNHKKIYVEL